jgi:hypothetical protein
MKLERVHRVISKKSALGELPLQKGGSTFKPAGIKRETKAGEVPKIPATLKNRLSRNSNSS